MCTPFCLSPWCVEEHSTAIFPHWPSRVIMSDIISPLTKGIQLLWERSQQAQQNRAHLGSIYEKAARITPQLSSLQPIHIASLDIKEAIEGCSSVVHRVIAYMDAPERNVASQLVHAGSDEAALTNLAADMDAHIQHLQLAVAVHVAVQLNELVVRSSDSSSSSSPALQLPIHAAGIVFQAASAMSHNAFQTRLLETQASSPHTAKRLLSVGQSEIITIPIPHEKQHTGKINAFVAGTRVSNKCSVQLALGEVAVITVYESAVHSQIQMQVRVGLSLNNIADVKAQAALELDECQAHAAMDEARAQPCWRTAVSSCIVM